MAKKPDDQIVAILYPDRYPDKRDKEKEGDGKYKSEKQENNNKPRNEEEKCDKYKHEKENDDSDSSSNQACCSCTCMVPADERRRQPEGNELWRKEAASSCCSLQELKRLPECDIKLGELHFSSTHTILINVEDFKHRQVFLPQEGREMWHSNFVKMPHARASVIVKPGFTQTHQCRWEVISKQLKALASKREVAVEDVTKAIIKYNPKYEKQWSFSGLVSFIKLIPKEENYFGTLFPKMAKLALKLPEYVKKAIPLLKTGQTAAITLSQIQISCLLANAFFCTFPHRNTSKPKTEYYGYPTINFSSLFGNVTQRKNEKLRAIMHYFKVVTEIPPRGLVTFERRCFQEKPPNWKRCGETLPKLCVTSEGSIESDGTGMLQVDFAASLIGGGVLGSGLLQEEILFLINPELIVSRLFTQKLEDNECLIITGSQQFSLYSGFGDGFEWAGPYDETIQRDKWWRLQRQIVAIDALHFKHRSEQYNMSKVTRELNKAYCGFKKDGHEDLDIATGKWGCGAFNGDPQLKALIQLMAAGKARRGLAFFTFGDEKLKRDLDQMYNLLLSEGVTVGQLFELVERYCDQRIRGLPGELFEFLRKTLRTSRSNL